MREFNYENLSGSFGHTLRRSTSRKNKNSRAGLPASKNRNKVSAYAPENEPLSRANRRAVKKYAMAEGEIRYGETPEEYAARISQEVGTAEPGIFTKICDALGQCFIRFTETKKNRRNTKAGRKNRTTRRH